MLSPALPLEVRSRLQVIRVQPVRAVLQQDIPHGSTHFHGPTRCIPKPRPDTPSVRITDKLRDVGELLLRNVADTVPSHCDLPVGGSERRKRRVPSRVQGRVGQLRQRRVEEVVSR